MGNIQLNVANDTVQMMWNEQVTPQDIYQAFRQLAQILRDNRHDMNLVVVVDASTQLPIFENFDGLPATLKNVRLRDRLIIGKNPRVNHTISTMLSRMIPLHGKPIR